MLENIALVIEYDGSNFYGFQKQPDVRTVQVELEQVLSKFGNHNIEVITAGRTDTGVHALYQVVNFTTSSKRVLNSWIRGNNALLPKDIVIKDACIMKPEFNARFSAISRTYKYYLYASKIRPSILHKKVGWYFGQLNIDNMKIASTYLSGQHDFASFRASSCQAASSVRTVSKIEITLQNNILCFEIKANAFLYHMVRNIIGALVYVGNNKITLESFKELIKVCNRKYAPPTFMPDGLYLTHVEYAEEHFKYRVENSFFN